MPLSSAGGSGCLPADVAELFENFEGKPQAPIKFYEKNVGTRKYRVEFSYKKGKKGRKSIKPKCFSTHDDAVQHMRALLKNLATPQPNKATRKKLPPKVSWSRAPSRAAPPTPTALV